MNNLIKNRTIIKYILTLQSSYSAIIPYFILLSTLILINFLLLHFKLLDYPILKSLINALEEGSSIVITISISYFFAIRLKVCKIIAILLSIATMFSILYFNTQSSEIALPHYFSILSIINPVISTFWLYLLTPLLLLHLHESDENKHVYRFFNYIFVFILSYFATVGSYLLLKEGGELLTDLLSSLDSSLPAMPQLIHYLIRDLTIQFYWFLGIHGSHTVNTFFGKEILTDFIFPNLTYGEFNRLFVIMGGAGAGIAMLIASLILLKDRSYRIVAKISIPFVLFNINTLLIYAFIVFNRFLFIPFLLIPILNILIAYEFISLFQLTFNDKHLIWMTPIFFNSYLKADNYLLTSLLQLLLLTVDTFIYLYFIRRFQAIRKERTNANRLKKSLNIQDEIRSEIYINSYVAHKEIIQADIELEKVLSYLKDEDLFVYYQPKITLKTMQSQHFEALLRYNKNGQIRGPFFLDPIEKAGLAPLIDIWVVKQVKEDLDRWKKENFYPTISINLHPDTIQNDKTITKIIEIIQGEQIIFEIIERSFLNGKVAHKNLHKLQTAKFGIAIDDFGVGYSSFETLIHFDIDELKLDKSLIDIIHTPKGYTLCKNITQLCHDINLKVVAEGVETKEQVELVKGIHIDLIQGYYYAKALPFEEVRFYSPP